MDQPFPKNFFWGTATSSHQVEGDLVNNWSQWESSKSRIQALQNKGCSSEAFVSGRACNSYEMQDADIECIKTLNNNAYRFSLDWSRIEPEEGMFSVNALNHYLDFVKNLKANGIEPFVTLWHWTFPLWAWKQGGFESSLIVERYARYVEKVVEVLGNDVQYWMTINEPNIYSDNSYLYGDWPPEKKSQSDRRKVLINLIKAHKKAYGIIKDSSSVAKIGVAKNNNCFEMKVKHPINWMIKEYYQWRTNEYFLNEIRDEMDFIGLNYYFHNLVNFGINQNENKVCSDLGWELYPHGLYHVLKDLKKYKVPIFVTENGLADSQDKHRKWFLDETFAAMNKAIKDGVDLQGYFHWSLLDNFEWAEGFGPKFGLFEVDRTTFERKPRQSAYYYRDLIKKTHD